MLECEEPIFIHCAFGHGRSATFAAAWLILKNHVSDAEGAEALMKRGRATVHINAIQRKGLVQYLEEMKKKEIEGEVELRISNDDSHLFNDRARNSIEVELDNVVESE
eukprot:CAMPEP_0201476546 /NCGR_PEP_ID=MMETSP0151_2-20130828/1733_1 /ASSEMBLY_ACC=CAM_ASM_000257 /TAXON_ID=200890 /ORGANISM="Paramoeba atlantica, Strain 621/1 / CCAP 1560/9" /LENGTH=107 /DNA_ID=CAMNT_0047856951 /DNA_START=578 /DNA_END=901 /DNA_ORIENTATION=+